MAGPVVPNEPETQYAILGFEDLEGWADDDHASALTVFKNTCADLDEPDWRRFALWRSTPRMRGSFSSCSFARC